MTTLLSAAKNKLNKIEKKRRPSRSSSRFRQVSPNVKSIRLTGAALGVLSAEFDLYHAVSAFRALSTTTDLKTRQDLMVKGSLYTAATSVGIGMAYVGALGGTAAALEGNRGGVSRWDIRNRRDLYHGTRNRRG